MEWQAVVSLAQRMGGQERLGDPSWRTLVAEAHFRQSLGYLQRERLRAACVEMEKAVSWQPDNGLYQFHLGLAWHRLDKWAEACAAYSNAWRLQPSWRVAYHLALAAVQAGGEWIHASRWQEICRHMQDTAASAQDRTAMARLVAWREEAYRQGARDDEAAAAGEAVADTAGTFRATTPCFWKGARNLPVAFHIEAALFSLSAGDEKAAVASIKKVLPDIEAPVADLDAAEQMVLLGAYVLAHCRSRQIDAVIDALERRLPQICPPGTAATSVGVDDAKEGLRFLVWALSQAGWQCWQSNRLVPAGRFFALACEYDDEQVESLQNLALCLEPIGSWDEIVEAWERYAYRIVALARSSREGRQWAEQLRLQTYLRLLHMGMERRETLYEKWLQAAVQSPVCDASDRLKLAHLAGPDQPGYVKQALRPLHSASMHDAELGREVARIYEDMDMPVEAREAWERVLGASPGDKEACEFLAQALVADAFKQMDAREGRATASKLLRRAVELSAADARPWAGLAIYHLLEQREDEAAQCLKHALELADSALKAVAVGGLFLTRGLVVKAQLFFDQALRFDNTTDVRTAIGLVYIHCHLEDAGLKYLRRVFADLGYDAYECLQIVHELTRTGAYAIALKLIGDLEKHCPPLVELLILKCISLLAQGMASEARRCVKKALKLAKSTSNDEAYEALMVLQDLANAPPDTDWDVIKEMVFEELLADGRKRSAGSRR